MTPSPTLPAIDTTDARCTLVAEGVTVARGGRTILHNVSLRVGPGEALLLTGPNGAGKSTLLRTVAGFLTPAAGRIALEGAPADTPVAQLAHVCGHLDGLKASLTVRENLAFWAAYLGDGPAAVTASDRIAAALSAFQLSALAEMPAAYLSAGQKRRLGLARVLTAPRPLWLLDEPTVSLDAASLALLLNVLRGHLAGGGLIVAATHVDLPLPGARTLRLGHAAAATVDESALS